MTHQATPPDQAARDRLLSVFDRNLLVEAGAGSGKTDSLAGRMAAGIATGVFDVEHLAAVTFTRKAAAELRGRFQLKLEAQLAASEDPGARRRIDHALRHIDRVFAGTIHAFCAHLLRERPVEARVAPGFVELDEVQDAVRRRAAWRAWVAQARQRGDPALLDLQAAGVRPPDLDGAFARVCDHDEVDFPAEPRPMPDVRRGWERLDAFWQALSRLRPDPLPEGYKCKVLRLAAGFDRRYAQARRYARPATLADLLLDWRRAEALTMKWWSPRGAEARALFEAFRREVADPFVVAWRHYVYHLVVTVLAQARRAYAVERRRANVVNYVDLLAVTARLLREDADVRRAVQRKFRWFFVDEFQDTDPLQAEILVRLAAEPDAPQPLDWGTVRLRPGALFVVGDPKQSIYRFRRADIEIYNLVRDRILDCGGELLRLTANWRSLPGVCNVANSVFPARFPASPSPESPAFEPLVPMRPPTAAAGLLKLTIPASVIRPRDVAAFEAERIAAFINEAVGAGRHVFSDFLVLTRYRGRLWRYARALESLDIPVEVSGAGRFGDSEEVHAIAALLRVLADPVDGPSLVGTLRGPLFGISDADLFRFRQAGGRFDLWAPLSGTDLEALTEAETSPADTAARTRIARLARRLGPALGAIRSLRAMQRLTRRLPLPAALTRILEDSGFLAMAAATPGGAAAGDLLQAVDVVRREVERGAGLAGAADALERDEAAGETEALPLEPGRRDVVRVMNLHKAKGLEARVVFLADPAHGRRMETDIRIRREGDRAEGFLCVFREGEDGGRRGSIAEPHDWAEHEAAEDRYLEAEIDRLLYVAATRARDLLVVGSWGHTRGGGKSANEAWGAFDAVLARAPELPVPDTVVRRPPAVVDLSPAARAAATTAREAAQQRVRQAGWAVSRVTGEHPAVRARTARLGEPASETEAFEATARATDEGGATAAAEETAASRALSAVVGDTPSHHADAGAAWGALVHGLLEHAARDRTCTREDLARLGAWLLVDAPELRPHLPVALDVVASVVGAPFFREARAAAESDAEIPFAVLQPGPDGPTVVRGVIDLAHTVADTWRIVDYKTDQESDVATLLSRHGEQLRAYLQAFALVTGAHVEAGVFGVRSLELGWLRGS
jgi:ATP-dependent helicase/nuclease subunit A